MCLVAARSTAKRACATMRSRRVVACPKNVRPWVVVEEAAAVAVVAARQLLKALPLGRALTRLQTHCRKTSQHPPLQAMAAATFRVAACPLVHRSDHRSHQTVRQNFRTRTLD